LWRATKGKIRLAPLCYPKLQPKFKD
jgi:hypothetical protein